MDPHEDVTVLVWRRKLGGDELLQIADGKSWRLPLLSEVGLRHARVDGPIGALAMAPAGFTPARTHRWVRIADGDDDVRRAFASTGAAAVVWRRGPSGPEILVLHRAIDGPDHDGDWAWTPPGGGLEIGESHEECASRELLEEAGLDLPLTRVHGCANDFAAYVAELREGEIVLSAEHDRYEWLSFDDACARCRPDAVVDTLRAARRYMDPAP